MFFVAIYPVGVLEVPAKVWESVTVCRHTNKNPKKQKTFCASGISAEIVTLLRPLMKVK